MVKVPVDALYWLCFTTEVGNGTPQDRVQFQRNVNEVRYSDRLRNFIDVEKDYDTLCVRVEHTPDLVRDRHDNQCRLLIGADVVKFHPLLHFFTRLQSKERARSPDAKDIFEIKVGRINRIKSRLDRGIFQERLHSRPIPFVVRFRRQANREIVRLIGPVKPVEPVAGIKTVFVKRLRAQDIVTGVEEWCSLANPTSARPRLFTRTRSTIVVADWNFVLVIVKERLVVVRRDVVDHIRWIQGITRRFAVVIKLAPST